MIHYFPTIGWWKVNLPLSPGVIAPRATTAAGFG